MIALVVWADGGMATAITALGDLRAHHEAMSLPTAQMVLRLRLRGLLGATLVAYLGEVKETRGASVGRG